MLPDELKSLIAPLTAEAPCGRDLEYEPAFGALLEATAGRREEQWGDRVYAAQEPDWRAVHAQALALAARTRDLRVACWLVRSGARAHGVMEAIDGLCLVQGLLQRHWAHLHPALDASDENDPTARINALGALVQVGAGLADLRCATLTGERGGVSVRDVELALAKAESFVGEAVPAPALVLQRLHAALAERPTLARRLQDGLAAVQAIAQTVDERVGVQRSVELGPLRQLLSRLAEATATATADAAVPAMRAAGIDAAAASSPRTGRPLPADAGPLDGTLASRDDAIHALERACEWLERHEPGHPAPLLIRRAQRLMGKGFLDLIRDLVPDGVAQVEKLAGTAAP